MYDMMGRYIYIYTYIHIPVHVSAIRQPEPEISQNAGALSSGIGNTGGAGLGFRVLGLGI